MRDEDRDISGRAPRLFVEVALASDGLVRLDEVQTNYLIQVLRLTPGDDVLVFNGRDGEWQATICRSGKRTCELQVQTAMRRQADGPDVHYLFAPLKRARLDYMVQKAVEMGVAALRPVMTRRTVAERVNLERMRSNAIEAAEQCGVLRIPEIAAPLSLARCLDDWPAGRRLIFCDEAAAARDPIVALQSLRELLPTGNPALAVLIGPEGGFAPEERERLLAAPSVTAISLGPRIMRADTAAVAALALVNAVLGDWSGGASVKPL